MTISRLDVAELSTADVAEELGVHVRTVRLWLAAGWISADRRTLGGHARFTRRTLKKLVQKARSRAA